MSRALFLVGIVTAAAIAVLSAWTLWRGLELGHYATALGFLGGLSLVAVLLVVGLKWGER